MKRPDDCKSLKVVVGEKLERHSLPLVIPFQKGGVSKSRINTSPAFAVQR